MENENKSDLPWEAQGENGGIARDENAQRGVMRKTQIDQYEAVCLTHTDPRAACFGAASAKSLEMQRRIEADILGAMDKAGSTLSVLPELREPFKVYFLLGKQSAHFTQTEIKLAEEWRKKTNPPTEEGSLKSEPS